MPAEQKKPQFRYQGWGWAWIEDSSQLSIALAAARALDPGSFERVTSSVLSGIDRARDEVCVIRDLHLIAHGAVDVQVLRLSGDPFDIYVMLDADNDDPDLLWCEIHAHPTQTAGVAVSQVNDRPAYSPAYLYGVELLDGLRLFAIGPPQDEPFGVSVHKCGVACLAWVFRSHKDADHTHKPGEAESGGLIPAFKLRKGQYADEVFFHGEVLSVEELRFFDRPVLRVDCHLDFGGEGSLDLPVYVPEIAKRGEAFLEPLQPGDFVDGVGSLQVFAVPETTE